MRDYQIVVGLVADEGFPTLAANDLARHLPDDLSAGVSDRIDWKVQVYSTRLQLDQQGNFPLGELAGELRSREGWDLVLALTDLPHRVDRRPIVSEFDSRSGVALASVPALGAVRIRRRARTLFVHLIRHLTQEQLGLADTEATRRRLRGTWQRISNPIAHIASDSANSELQLALIGLRGRARLLAGMVRDNRPWRLVPHLARATAAAAATAAYGLVNASFWTLAQSLPTWRLAVINAVAVIAMAVWLLVYNHLWDRPQAPAEREAVLFNNVSTLVTLVLGVVFMYAILFALTLLAAGAIVDSGYLHKQVGHPAGMGDYATITWLAASVGIVAGALGSSLETEDAVEKATYSRREQQRRQRDDTGDTGDTDSADSAMASNTR